MDCPNDRTPRLFFRNQALGSQPQLCMVGRDNSGRGPPGEPAPAIPQTPSHAGTAPSDASQGRAERQNQRAHAREEDERSLGVPPPDTRRRDCSPPRHFLATRVTRKPEPFNRTSLNRSQKMYLHICALSAAGPHGGGAWKQMRSHKGWRQKGRLCTRWHAVSPSHLSLCSLLGPAPLPRWPGRPVALHPPLRRGARHPGAWRAQQAAGGLPRECGLVKSP